MFGLDLAAQIEGMEWIVILIIIAVLFLFGPSKLPEMARGVGRAIGEFKRGRMEVEKEISSLGQGDNESSDKTKDGK